MEHFGLSFPDGRDGQVSELRFISDTARDWARSPVSRVTAALVLRSCGATPRTPTMRAACLLAWVSRSIQYVPDPHGVEALQAPGATLALGIGDCDDVTLLLLSLASAVGIRGRPVGLGSSGQLFHVAPELHLAGRWLMADPTIPPGTLGAHAGLTDRLEGPEV